MTDELKKKHVDPKSSSHDLKRCDLTSSKSSGYSSSCKEELHKKLETLNIKVPNEVPLSHTFERKVTRGLSRDMKQKIFAHGIQLKNGSYSRKEDGIIRSNWELFKRIYGFNNADPFLPTYPKKIKYDQRKKFIQFLGMGLPDRSLSSIYRRFVLLYQSKFKWNRFTVFEDKLIVHCKKNNTEMPFVMLSRILGRDRHDIYKHYNNMFKKFEDYPLTCEWNSELKRKLILLISYFCEKDVYSIQHKTIKQQVWNTIGKVLHLHPLSCRSYWEERLSTQLFVKKPLYKNEIRALLFYKLFKLNIIFFRHIKWRSIAREIFPGVGPVFLQRLYWKSVIKIVPESKWYSVKACAKYILRHWIPKVLWERVKEKKLKRLVFRNNELFYLND